MTDDVANLILERLRPIDAKLDTVIDETRELRLRVTAIEVQIGATSSHLDRLDARVARIERRLDLVDG
jgi:hypothetical protein